MGFFFGFFFILIKDFSWKRLDGYDCSYLQFVGVFFEFTTERSSGVWPFPQVVLFFGLECK
jgi:hypothetical protein